MDHKSCPDCGRQLSLDSLRCGCGYRFREMGFGWTEGLSEWSVPKNRYAWFFILSACPLALALFAFLAWLDWFHLATIAGSIMTGGALLLPLATQYLPTFRLRGGGCCLGCLTWISLALGICIAGYFWSFGDPVVEREVIPIAQMESGPCKIDGILLGDPAEQVMARPGPWTRQDFPYFKGTASYSLRSDQGTLVTFKEGRAIRVEGKVLAQGDNELLRPGMPRRNVAYLFDASQHHTPRRRYLKDGINYDFRVLSGEVVSVTMSPLNAPFVQGPSPITVNGIALGERRENLPSPPTEELETGWRYGEALVYCDGQGRIVAVRGTSLERQGEVIARKGDKSPFDYQVGRRPSPYGGVMLTANLTGNPHKVDWVAIKQRD